MEYQYQCPYCWQRNDLQLYIEDGERQSMVIDCRVCCQPTIVTAEWNSFSETFDVAAEREAGE